MTATIATKFDSHLVVKYDSGESVIAYSDGRSNWIPRSNVVNLISISMFGEQIVLLYSDGSREFGVKAASGFFIISAIGSIVIPPDDALIDTISPGHTVTNPGGTVASGWQWHLDNNSGRGGVDWNYNFVNFTAPGAGTVDHFDVSGVGMVVRLILDTPADRIDPQLTNDEYGPMTAIWFQHCSAAVDGHAEQGDVIGTSGDGYGDYGAHLHVHGMIDNGTNASVGHRCNFWGFV